LIRLFLFWKSLSVFEDRKKEARLRETNWSSKNGVFVDGLVTLPRKIKVLINKEAQPWTLTKFNVFYKIWRLILMFLRTRFERASVFFIFFPQVIVSLLPFTQLSLPCCYFFFLISRHTSAAFLSSQFALCHYLFNYSIDRPLSYKEQHKLQSSKLCIYLHCTKLCSLSSTYYMLQLSIKDLLVGRNFKV
jgi:hypothetical protein